jgi:NADH-quinone oxidoreductase subunit K
VLTFFVITVAAAEAAIGLAIIISLFRNKETAYVDDMTETRG